MFSRGSAWVRSAVAFLVAACLLLCPADWPLAAAQSDLDAFMQQVVARRDDNWKKLQQYILDEHETIELRGPSHSPVWGERRDYTWYLRDGFFVRSPLKSNGVTIGEAERRQYEDEFLGREQRRERRAARSGDLGAPSEPSAADQAPVDLDGLIRQTRQPEFVSSAYFLRFKFDEGRYGLVGRERLDEREVLRIEYYPSKLFSDSQGRSADGARGRGGQNAWEDERLRLVMNKASLVTLWVDPTSHQIVKYTFDNVTPNFVPANWLGTVTDAHAVMTMGQPFPDIWLPRGLEMSITLTLAIGNFDLRYSLDYSDYRRAQTSSTLHLPDLP